MNINEITQYFPPSLTETLLIMGTKDMQEIRIVADKNAATVKSGVLLDTGVKISCEMLRKIVDSMCRGSLYAMQQYLSQGFLTLPGGHRVGVCGRCVTENGQITHMTDISAICLRISRAVPGAADGIMEYLEYRGRLYNALIISPPGCGKTTILRDASRQLGNRYKVCIADERSEIAACRNGVPCHDVGRFTCVIDSVPKAQGIMMLLRTMAPEVIVTDETGSFEEEEAIHRLINCGVKIITTAHGYSEKDISGRTCFGSLIEKGIFERIIVLSNRLGIATVEKIITDGKVMRRV